MAKYDPERPPDPDAWLELDESERIDLVTKYHRRHQPDMPQVRAHATFHAIVENQLALNEPVVVETLARLQKEGLSRHEAIHAIGSVLATQVYHLLKHDATPSAGDRNEAYASDLRRLTAQRWRTGG